MPRVKITSLTNPHIKDVVRLWTASHRKESGLTIVEGAREVSRALEGKIAFKEFYICEEFLNSEGKELIAQLEPAAEIYDVTSEVFEKISYGERKEGILGVCDTPQRSLADFRIKSNPLIVIIEHVEKPGNIGAILRTCDAAGVDGVIITDAKTDLYNPNVIRASLGTVFTVNAVVSSNEAVLRLLKEKKINICAALPKAKGLYTQMNWVGPFAIVLGSEEEGLSDFWDKNADARVKIPMYGHADSLNVSTSAAILIYEAIRQRTMRES